MLLQIFLEKKNIYDVIFEEMGNQMPTTNDLANFIIDAYSSRTHDLTSAMVPTI